MSLTALLLFTLAATVAQVLAALILARIKRHSLAGQIEQLRGQVQAAVDASFTTRELATDASANLDALRRAVLFRLAALEAPRRSPRVSDSDPGDEHRVAAVAGRG